MMRTVKSSVIRDAVKELCLKANIELRSDVLSALKYARDKELNLKARRILDIIIENAYIAKRKNFPICQDTGMVMVYVEIGQAVAIKGDLNKAIEEGVAQA